MANRNVVERMPYTPKAVKSAFTNQTVRLPVRDNKRLKRAALKQRKSFNAWAVQILIDAADAVLNPTKDTL
jgi:predicted HicB family RNase H-like nuclease